MGKAFWTWEVKKSGQVHQKAITEPLLAQAWYLRCKTQNFWDFLCKLTVLGPLLVQNVLATGSFGLLNLTVLYCDLLWSIILYIVL